MTLCVVQKYRSTRLFIFNKRIDLGVVHCFFNRALLIYLCKCKDFWYEFTSGLNTLAPTWFLLLLSVIAPALINKIINNNHKYNENENANEFKYNVCNNIGLHRTGRCGHMRVYYRITNRSIISREKIHIHIYILTYVCVCMLKTTDKLLRLSFWFNFSCIHTSFLFWTSATYKENTWAV